MKTTRCIAGIAAALLLLASQPFASEETVVVVNKGTKVDTLSTQDVSQIYLGKKTLWPTGGRIVPVLLEPETPSIGRFLIATLRKNVAQYRSYWKRRLYSGGGSVPRTFRTSEEAVAFVARTPGAIGVVESSAADDRVQLVTISGK